MSETLEPTPSDDGALTPPNNSSPANTSTNDSPLDVGRPGDDRSGPERAGQGHAGQGRSSRGGAKLPIASEEDCLAALSRLPALNMLGMIDVRQANAYRGIYATILQHGQRRQASPTTALDHPGLLDLLRKDPALAGLLEPLFTQEEIARMLSQARDEGPQAD
ncbi:MAG TPA: hypothetical protein VN699_14985 [Pirellulales bacterium]|nr:hypothetical protein [Pirellulales bacterium]